MLLSIIHGIVTCTCMVLQIFTPVYRNFSSICRPEKRPKCYETI